MFGSSDKKLKKEYNDLLEEIAKAKKGQYSDDLLKRIATAFSKKGTYGLKEELKPNGKKETYNRNIFQTHPDLIVALVCSTHWEDQACRYVR